MRGETEIRRLTVEDAEALWKLRLTALETEPRGFSASPEAHHLPTVEAVAQQLQAGGDDNFVVGALDEGQLIGMAGFHREMRPKLRHKGHVWGVFVLPSHRGSGSGRRMIVAIIGTARGLEGLRQIQLSVATTQEAARRTYAGLGFRSFGIEPEGIQVEGVYIDVDQLYLRLV